MKPNSDSKNNILFTSEEEKLLKKYLEEYNELYQKILHMSSNDFFQILVKRVEINLKEKFNGFSQNSKTLVENFINEKVYKYDYKFALFVKKNILQRNSSEKESFLFKEEIIPHCENDKNDGYYIHTCGKRFQIFKYKPNSYLSIFFKNKNIKEKDYLIYCEECDMIYKSDLIKFKCNSTKEDFYSKLIDTNSKNNFQLATWKKYHCNLIINDAMKCQKCHENLYFLTDKNLLFCKKCNLNFDPKKLVWKCIKCKADFISEIKIFNPLEYKNMKICVKETILKKRKAKPNYLGCGCNGEINKMKFFHKNSCNGELFFGELNDKKMIVCSKCESLGMYDGYVWTCPICLKRFKNKIQGIENNYVDINEDENNKKEIYNKFFNYSNNNWNIKRNNIGFSKSPTKLNKRLFLLDKNYYSKENEPQSDIKNTNSSSRNNSFLNLIRKKRCISGLNSQNKFLGNKENISIQPEYHSNIRKVNIPKNINYSPNKNHIKLKSKLIQISRNYSNFKRPNKLMSNFGLTDSKSLEKIFNKCFNGNKNNDSVMDSQNINIISREKFQKDNLKNNYLMTDNDLGDKVILNNKYKKAIVNSSSKVINKPSSRNKTNNELKINKNNSNFTKINLNENINISNNNIINNENKVAIKKINICKLKNVNNRTSESTSPDSKGEKSPKDNMRKSPNKANKDLEINKNKKVVPGELNINNYIIKKQIGQGSFGQIFLVEDAEHKKYALKKIIAASSHSIKSIKNELQILLDIQNSGQKINTVNIYGITSYPLDITTYALYVLMELASTDWEKEILERKKTRKYYTEYELMSILFCLAKSLSILQKQNISHRDIKPQNVLILKDSNSNKVYKLADFGEAKELLSGEKPTNKQTLRGTELYMSPILFYALRGRKKMKHIQHNPYKSDVFSLGLCALFAATLGYESLYEVRELKNNISIFMIVEKYLRNKYSDSVINIISKMLDLNETTRVDFIQLEMEFNKLGYY